METDSPILKIAVKVNGLVTVNGSPTTIDSLRASLAHLAEQNGVVWYYRESGQSEAPPESDEIIKAVIENRLPIKLSSLPDYSDAIGTDGPTACERGNASRGPISFYPAEIVGVVSDFLFDGDFGLPGSPLFAIFGILFYGLCRRDLPVPRTCSSQVADWSN